LVQYARGEIFERGGILNGQGKRLRERGAKAQAAKERKKRSLSCAGEERTKGRKSGREASKVGEGNRDKNLAGNEKHRVIKYCTRGRGVGPAKKK